MSHLHSLSTITCRRRVRIGGSHKRIILPWVITILAVALVFAAKPALAAFMTFIDKERDGVNGVSTLNGIFESVVSPDGKHVYAVADQDSALTAFSRDAATGAMTYIEAHVDNQDGVDGLGGAQGIDISPDGAHIYVVGAATYEDKLAVFSRDDSTGELTFVEFHEDNTNGVDGLQKAWDVKVSPDGKHVYAASFEDDAISIFSRETPTGTLTYVGIVKNGVGGVKGINGPEGLAISPDGAFVYSSAIMSDAVSVFSRNETTGELTFVECIEDSDYTDDGCSKTRTYFDGPQHLTVSPDGKSVYVAVRNDDVLTVFSRNSGTGKLTIVEEHRDGVDGVNGLNHAFDLVVSTDNAYLFVTGYDDDALTLFRRDTDTGALTYVELAKNNVDCTDCLDGPRGVVIFGHHIYVAVWVNDALTVFSLPDLGVAKTNNTNDIGYAETAFDWTITISNTDYVSVTYSDGQTIFRDDLPSGPTYGAPSVQNSTNISGTIAFVTTTNAITGTANGDVTIGASTGRFDVVFSVTPNAAGELTNPSDGAGDLCAVDSQNIVPEFDESNNTCTDTLTVLAPDLEATKTNNTGGVSAGGAPFTWTVTISNTGAATATFNDGETVFRDNLPGSATYGTPVLRNFTDITNSGNITYTLTGNTLTVTVSGGDVTLGASTGSFDVAFSVTPTALGDLVNPEGGVCKVDPDSVVVEDDESNNTCTDTVSVVRGSVTVEVDRTDDTADQACTTAANDCSLRGAINKANSDDLNEYTITLPGGTYALTGAADEDDNASGDLDISADPTINGAGAATTIITGGGVDRILHILSGASVEVDDIQITGGQTPASTHGGGLYNAGALTINRSTVTQNQAGNGIDGTDGETGLDGIPGSHGGAGGGIYNTDALTLTNSTINGNSTGAGGDGGKGGDQTGFGSWGGTGGAGGDGGAGGGIFNTGTLTVINSTLSGNSTGAGGQGGAGGDNNDFGGIGGLGGDGGYGGSGGGIANQGDTGTLTFTTVTTNTCGTGGAGGAGGNGGASNGIAGSAGNTGNGAGISVGGGTVNVKNTILAGNASNDDASGNFTSRSYNLIGNGDSATGFTNGVNNDQVGSAASPIDPKLGPLQDNGGPTHTHALLNSSPALEKISADTNGCGTDYTTDQRGETRPGTKNDQVDKKCEIGAWEAQSSDPSAVTLRNFDARSGVGTRFLQGTAFLGLTLVSLMLGLRRLKKSNRKNLGSS